MGDGGGGGGGWSARQRVFALVFDGRGDPEE